VKRYSAVSECLLLQTGDLCVSAATGTTAKHALMDLRLAYAHSTALCLCCSSPSSILS
jgi:hypothetical protein